MSKRVKLEEVDEYYYLVNTTWIELNGDGEFQENQHLMMPQAFISKLMALVKKHERNEDRLSALMLLTKELLQWASTKDEEIRSFYHEKQKKQFSLLFSHLSGGDVMPDFRFLPHAPYAVDSDSDTGFFKNVFLWKNFDDKYYHNGKDCDCDYDYDETHKDYKVLVGEACDFHREFTSEELTITS